MNRKSLLALALCAAAVTLHAEQLPEIWGNVWYMTSWRGTGGANNGYYKFSPETPLSFENIGKNEDCYASGGFEFRDGKLHVISANFNRASDGSLEAYPTYYCIDTRTWKTVKSQSVSNHALVACETAYDAVNKKTWGIFYTADMKGCEVGSIDYTTLTRTNNGAVDHEYVALGITKEGDVYGIAEDAFLYHIDKNTGTETAIGNTGVSLTDNYWHTFSRQTGEIDQRTNTFYWACIDSNSNSYLYKVSLNTGKATLIGEFPEKASIYGMYIPQPEAEASAPDKVTDLAITPGEKGALTALLTFKAPAKCVDGSAISGNIDFEVKRGISVVGKVEDVAPGAETSFSDAAVPEDGEYEYTITPLKGETRGEKIAMRAYIGLDEPVIPTYVILADKGDRLTLSWPEASTTGAHGGYVDPEGVTYLVCDVREIDGKVTPVARAQVEGALSYDITDADLSSGDNRVVYFGLAAKNRMGQSHVASSAGLVGGPVTKAPFLEDFTYGTPSNFWWITKEGNTPWKILRFEGYDDYGYASFQAISEKDQAWLNTTKISTDGRKAKLSFAYGTTPGADIQLHVYAVDPENTPYDLTNIDFLRINDGQSVWRTESVDLPEALTAKSYFMVKFHVSSSAAVTEFLLDKVAVDPVGDSAIDNIEADAEATESPETIYNLQGMPVNGHNLTPGIYIKGGKKVFLKK